MTLSRQLPLPFCHQPAYDEADFIPDASNATALAWLQRTRDWPDGRLLLWGAPGCGKSHLLNIWVASTGADLLQISTPPGLPPRASSNGMAIDDAERIAAMRDTSGENETTLLHLLNTARDAACPVLLTARTPPSRWTIRLPDLSSRLRAITAVEIGPAGPDLLQALLVRLLADRQLRIARDLQNWLLQHLARTPAALREAVSRLELAVQDGNRRLSKALVARLLAITEPEDASSFHLSSSIGRCQ